MNQRKTSAWRGFLFLGALAMAPALVAARSDPAVPAPPQWVAGKVFEQRLAQPISAYCSGKPFREAVMDLARAQQVALLIDRRVDPGQQVDWTIHNTPLWGAFQEIASRGRLGVSRFGPVVYFGPPGSAEQLGTVAEMGRDQVRRLPPVIARRFARSAVFRWGDFAAPRDLLAALAQQAGAKIERLDEVPHDLWAGADLPPLPLADRLTLVAFQLDLTFQVASDGRFVRLVPLPKEAAIVRSYPRGSQPDHSASNSPQDPARMRFTLDVAQSPLGPILEQLALQLKAQAGVEMTIDREAIRRGGISLDKRVSFKVGQATLDELLRAVLQGTGCTFRRRGNSIEIRPE